MKKNKKQDISLRMLDDRLELNPQDIEALEKRAWLRAQNEDSNGAIEDYLNILELIPCHYIALYNLGVSRMVYPE